MCAIFCLGSVDPGIDSRGYRRKLHGRASYNPLSRLSSRSNNEYEQVILLHSERPGNDLQDRGCSLEHTIGRAAGPITNADCVSASALAAGLVRTHRRTGTITLCVDDNRHLQVKGLAHSEWRRMPK